MLIHLKLDNFKIWKSTGPIRLAPVTLLLGTNSSGKSSLIQSLLLIRQTVKGDDPNVDLNFGNPDSKDSVTLGQFKDVLCRQADNNRLGIEFRWSVTGSRADSTLFSARYRESFAGSAELDYLRLGKDGQGFTVERQKQGVFRLQLANERKNRGQSADFRPEYSFAFSPLALAKLGTAAESLKDIGPQLLNELGRIIYLGPVRKLAQRDYVWNGRMPTSIGDDGAKAIDVLIASGVMQQNAKRRGQELPPEAALFTQTGEWLKKMNIADGLAIKSVGGSARYELQVIKYDEASNLKDVGVGVAQVLPVIVAALHANQGHIVIVEEPESHLHPLAQSMLAELFADTSKTRRVQFIVETHSEHLFRRMQTLMAQQELSTEDCAMYFVDREITGAKLIPLEADKFGRIKNWPDNFFGDTLGETRMQSELMIKRIKEERENARLLSN